MLVIDACGFIGQHLVCRPIGLCDNSMAQGVALIPRKSPATPSDLAVVDQPSREGGFDLAVNACLFFLPDDPVPCRLRKDPNAQSQ